MGNPGTHPAVDAPRIQASCRGWRRATGVGLVVLACAFASAGQAQVRDYPDLNDAAYGLALELVHEGKLGGKKVLVSPRYFFERETERSLRLSAHLAGKFASALRGRDVEVVSGSEQSGVMTLRGEWTIERRSESLHLSVEVKKLEIEKRHDGSEVSERRVVASEDGQVHTAPVGGYRANGYGLHDMLGNVWEWTCSEYDEGYGGAERRCASGSGGRRVIRGGSWTFVPGWVRSAFRYGGDSGNRFYTLGFRLAQD